LPASGTTPAGTPHESPHGFCTASLTEARAALLEGDLPTPAFVSEAAKASLDRGETFSTTQGGIPELREAIAFYMTAVYGAAPGGAAFSPNSFFVTIGGMHAIEIATRLIAGPGDEALIPSPAWRSFVGAVETSGARVVPVPLDRKGRWSLDPERLAAAVTQFPRQSDRLHRHPRGDRGDARHRPPPRSLDHCG
jgi:aspartate/methionine/tyrosine aminotransferase